jgi:hypothetical protein
MSPDRGCAGRGQRPARSAGAGLSLQREVAGPRQQLRRRRPIAHATGPGLTLNGASGLPTVQDRLMADAMKPLEKVLAEADTVIRVRLKEIGLEVPHLVVAVTPNGEVVLRSKRQSRLRSFSEDLKNIADELDVARAGGHSALICSLAAGGAPALSVAGRPIDQAVRCRLCRPLACWRARRPAPSSWRSPSPCSSR